ncbi:MAG: chromosome segregation protein SMC [Nitrospirae bacterium]|nr:chromosome segregation protein SMC [Nitrospirota bacterium]
MKIKNIELNGFKSFADKTILPLHDGITCIVGPNGCGKSNIVDAFRWVLGEQSAKSLRGDKMEEVIFQGSNVKKQRAMADVTLTFSGSAMWGGAKTSARNGTSGQEAGAGNGGKGQGASDEISVSRRLYRSGESDYLLNNRTCRLRDIKDIFLDTGLDVKSYSILDQGKIGEIISAKPQDRRFLIEEVAGVMKYKVRKAEALSKLESSRQNLQRINDIVYEIKRQINSLDRQVKKAERYKRLIDELMTIELRLAWREYNILKDNSAGLETEIEKAKGRESAVRGEMSTIENEIQGERIKLIDAEKLIIDLESSLSEKEKSLSSCEKNAAVLHVNRENKKNEILRLTDLISETDRQKSALHARITEIETLRGVIESEISAVSGELLLKKTAAEDIEASIEEGERQIEEMRNELFSLSEALSSRKSEIHKLQASMETLKYRESVSATDIENIKNRTKTLEDLIRDAEINITASEDELKALLSDKGSITSRIEALRKEIENGKTLLANEREELAANISRLKSLEELAQDSSIIDLASEIRDKEAGCSLALLADMLNASKEQEVAIEAVLADRLNALIVEKPEDIFSTVNIIEGKDHGRIAILYADILRKREDDDLKIDDVRIIGKASDFISYYNNPKSMPDIMKNIYIVKDLRDAVDILFGASPLKPPASSIITLATLDGEVINSDGWIMIGRGKEILKRRREIKELQKTVEGQQLKTHEIESTLNNLSDQLVGQKDALKENEEKITAIERGISISRHRLDDQRNELDREMRRLTFIDTEAAALSQEFASIEERMRERSEGIETMEKERLEVETRLRDAQGGLSDKRDSYEDVRSQLTDIKLNLASLTERGESFKNEIAGIARSISDIEIKRETSIKEIADAEETIKGSSAEIQSLDETMKTLVVEVDEMKRARAEKRESASSINQLIVEKENNIRSLRMSADEISDKLGELNSASIEASFKMRAIEDGMTQKYGIDINAYQPPSPDEVPPKIDAEADMDRINELNEKIKELGHVNLGTLEEYDELRQRYEFLTKQQSDLTMSIAELEEAITRINATTKKRIREAYESLRAKFSEVFTVLFGGGGADLVLTDEGNILESGLDIIAQPPGKRLQNINLLSGGEKALTSLALLFAGFLIKPSPLCILDEADAPLDESNTERFAQMLKELSKETQFIVITHNRTSMEAADYLYGVTMEEPGASKTISLQFSEADSVN